MLGRRVREGERDSDAAGAPRPEEGRDERYARGGEDRDALLLERRAPVEERRGAPPRGREELRVRRAPPAVDDGRPGRVPFDSLEERQRSKISLPMMSRWIWLVPS